MDRQQTHGRKVRQRRWYVLSTSDNRPGLLLQPCSGLTVPLCEMDTGVAQASHPCLASRSGEETQWWSWPSHRPSSALQAPRPSIHQLPSMSEPGHTPQRPLPAGDTTLLLPRHLLLAPQVLTDPSANRATLVKNCQGWSWTHGSALLLSQRTWVRFPPSTVT